MNTLFVRFFCLFFPFGLLQEFNKLNDGVTGFMHGNMIWLVVPFSVMVSWMYTSLEPPRYTHLGLREFMAQFA